MKEVQKLLPTKKLFLRTSDLVGFCERNTLDDTKERIIDLKTSLLLIASNVCEDHVQMHVFGSRLTGLAERSSDVDIYAQIGEDKL